MSNNSLPEFQTNRLILRGVTQADIPSYQKYFSDYEVINHLSAVVPWPFPDDGVQQFLDTFVFPDQGSTQWLWGIFEKLIFANAVGNLKSRRVKEKTGARLIDVRPAKFVNPKYTQHEVWELLKSEWFARKM